jgi:hypothetical protein
MQIEGFIVSVYCCVENLFNEVCKNLKLRQRGFQHKFTDIEVLTIEIVGEFLGF